MALLAIFLLGIGNFTLHKAVLESKHPLLGEIPGFSRVLGGRLTLATEFIILLAAMLLAGNGWPGIAWAYAGYSGLNGLAAWLILNRRV
ncbi:hypothetical protein [Parerythrobacter jejuensis]|uniref:DUF3784 domain-containing protein n=1 Tax=Parerythrobacter jejuensis TaxID=795812 RepID=A0A845AJR4_9SPHN|nr:hypothetical protein [Parerythrobacter jejuensis]MXP30972.1 hypothetical protein [Parerythrobacter jejuensis]MXP33732.1 hypothetical protein [Parerythrobacter jejuensis]